MNKTREKRQAGYTMMDLEISFAVRCENYDHKLGDWTFEDSYAWLFVRVAEVTRKALRNQYLIREPVAELLEEARNE